MNAKEKAIIGNWLDEIDSIEQQRNDLYKELSDLYRTRGGVAPLQLSMLARYDYLQVNGDRETRDKAKIIWTQYHELNARINERNTIGKRLSDIGAL